MTGERQPIAIVAKPAIQPEVLDATRERFQKVIPAEHRAALVRVLGGDTAEAERQMHELAIMVAGFQTGIRSMPSAEHFLSTSYAGDAVRIGLAAEGLRGLIALDLVALREREARGEITEAGFQNLLARKINRIALYVESEEGTRGHEKLATALDQLSDAEQTILFLSMSTHMKVKMDYPDREQCDEEQMAKYFHDAIYGKHGIFEEEGELKRAASGEEILDRVSILIDTCYERLGSNFNARGIFTRLLRPPYRQETLRRIIEAAYFAGKLDLLESILQDHPDTALYARRCREYLDGERVMKVPIWMKDSEDRPHRRQD
ncbi:MAG: hypothetical protein HY431_01530 [Candidatus Levybacteria bacterium]|nr:hypothetical protein [Candidatus Levybacteria bacterium]